MSPVASWPLRWHLLDDYALTERDEEGIVAENRRTIGDTRRPDREGASRTPLLQASRSVNASGADELAGALTERTAAVVDSGPVVQPTVETVGPGRGEDARPVRSVSASLTSSAAASPAAASPGTRGTGGRFTSKVRPLPLVPDMCWAAAADKDAYLPVVPDGGVQAPGAGARAPEPTSLSAAPFDPKGECR